MDPTTRPFTPKGQRPHTPVQATSSVRSNQLSVREHQHARVRSRDLDGVSKKIFNCIVDETALVQGTKKSTRDGIRKWVASGQMRLFVPLHALNETTRMKERNGRVASDADDALQWLDDATSNSPHLVTLQGGFEQFGSWNEVAKFALPRTLFSEGDDDLDELAQKAEDNLAVQDLLARPQTSLSSNGSFASQVTPLSDESVRSGSPLSPQTSPLRKLPASVSPRSRDLIHDSISDSPVRERSTTAEDINAAEVPRSLRSLMNYILWRIHQEVDPTAALENFIFLCDDPVKRQHAHRFGVRTKSLTDIRFAIVREEQEARNRELVQKKEAEKEAVKSKALLDVPDQGGLLSAHASPTLSHAKPVVAAISAAGKGDSTSVSFSKQPPKAPAAMLASPSSRARGNVLDSNNFTRAAIGPPRGNMRGAQRGSTPRGGHGSRGAAQPENDGPIDPDSFTRPNTARGGFRGGRKLWMPT